MVPLLLLWRWCLPKASRSNMVLARSVGDCRELEHAADWNTSCVMSRRQATFFILAGEQIATACLRESGSEPGAVTGLSIYATSGAANMT